MNHLHNNKSEQTTDSSFTLDIEQLLKQGNVIRIKPQGTSMYPLFVPGRDEACIERTDFSSLKRGDVILYRRDKSILVLHRIWKITNNSFYMVGDNQTEIEGPLRADQVRGKLTAFVHNGKFVNVKNPIYRFTSSLWLFLRPSVLVFGNLCHFYAKDNINNIYHFFFCFFSTLLMFFSEISNAVFLFIRLTFQ